MDNRIYAPRGVVTLLRMTPHSRNPSVCVKLPYKGYEISIAMDSSHGDGDLRRSDITVDDPNGVDVTFALLSEYDGIVPATTDVLKELFASIDELVAEPA